MAPPTAPSGKARQTTLSGGWALNGANLWTSTRRSASPPPRSAAAQPLVYQITETTQLLLQRGDITRWEGDAVVNAANERMLGGGGVDGAIHRAAGPQLRRACWEVPEVARGVRCPTGEARITPGFQLPAKAVIHTVGPVYDEDYAEECARELISAHKACLRIANQEGFRSIAFPAISCGVYGYPIAEAAELSLEVVKRYAGGLREVAFLLHDQPAWDCWRRAAASGAAGPPVSRSMSKPAGSGDGGDGDDAETEAPEREDYQGRRTGSPADGSPRAGHRGVGSLSFGRSAEPARPANSDAATGRARQAVVGSRGDEAAGGGGGGGDATGFSGRAAAAPLRLGSKSRSRSRSPGLEAIGRRSSGDGSPRRDLRTAAAAAPAQQPPLTAAGIAALRRAEAAPGGAEEQKSPSAAAAEARKTLSGRAAAAPQTPAGGDPFDSLFDTEDQVAGLEHVQLNSTARTAEAPADADGPDSTRVAAMLAEARNAEARKRPADDANARESAAEPQAADGAAFSGGGGGGGGGGVSAAAAAMVVGTAEPAAAKSPAAPAEQRPTESAAEAAGAAAEPAAVGSAAPEAAAATPMETDDWELLAASEEAQGGGRIEAAAENDGTGAGNIAEDGAAADAVAAADESAPAQKKQKPSP